MNTKMNNKLKDIWFGNGIVLSNRYVSFPALNEIISADDSQQKIEHLERRILTLEDQLDSLVKIQLGGTDK